MCSFPDTEHVFDNWYGFILHIEGKVVKAFGEEMSRSVNFNLVFVTNRVAQKQDISCGTCGA